MARVKVFLVALVTISAVAEAGRIRIRRDTDECEKINLAECLKA